MEAFSSADAASVGDSVTVTVDGQAAFEALEAASQPSAQAQNPWKPVFKAGLSMILFSTGGILNPPIDAPAMATISHATFLSGSFHCLVFVCVAIGVLLVLLSAVLRRHSNPRLVAAAEQLIQIGWALLSIALGYGSALIIMVSSPPWLALSLLFLLSVYVH